MHILVFNSGSSSLKFALFAIADGDPLTLILTGAITDLGRRARWSITRDGHTTTGQDDLADHRAATHWALARLQQDAPMSALAAVGHRVVHGGPVFDRPALLDSQTLSQLQELSALAPLHNPLALQVIDTCRDVLGNDVPMVAVFDTAFHSGLPEAARRYAVPAEWTKVHGIRRYGFHGIAHRYMYERYTQLAGASSEARRIITFQLGHGCSVCAIRDGRSLETSMGYTPLEGLVMSTRCGDVDPGVLVRLIEEGVPAATLEEQLNGASGLLALSGETADMRELLALEAQGHAGARLAIEVFCHRARKYLGAYLAVLGGVDAVLFGGGIGEHAPAIRARICEDMEWCGLQMDVDVNAAAIAGERRISAPASRVAIHVIAVDEERVIARDTRALLVSKGLFAE